MAISFLKNRRTIMLSGFSAEADPNVSPPNSSEIFKIDSHDGQGLPASGHVLVGKFDTEEPTGTAAYQTWFRDSANGDWYKFPPDVLTHRVGKVTKALLSIDLFIQITAFTNPGAATSFTVSAAEL